VCEDLDEALEGLLAAGHAMSAKGDLLREEREEVAQPGSRLAAQGDVVVVAGVHLPALTVEATSPPTAGIVDELGLWNAAREIRRGLGTISDDRRLVDLPPARRHAPRVATILDARHCLLASALQLHPRTTVVLDPQAAAGLPSTAKTPRRQ
jgi:hypothetical protein